MQKNSQSQKPGFPRFILHLHPPRIPAISAKFTYTFGLGGLAFLSFVLTTVTGLLLLFVYSPEAGTANESVQQIATVVSYGWYVRNLHYWSAQIMVIAVLLHLFRVLFTGGYLNGRRLNWIIGIFLLFFTLLVDFTGFTLRWDSESHWALVTGTNLMKTIPYAGQSLYRFIVGGPQIGGATLLRMYAWHIFGLPFIIFGLTIYHFWRIRKEGGISARFQPSRQQFISREKLLLKESQFLLAGSTVFILLSVFFTPHLGVSAEKSLTAAAVHAPWIFLWIQFLLRYFPAFLAGIILPVLLLAWLGILPYRDKNAQEVGIWFAPERRRVIYPVIAVFIFILCISLIEAVR